MVFTQRLPTLRAVEISGYDGDAMEPFVTRDGRYLLFNNLNEPRTNTDIFFAERKDDYIWTYRGRVKGIDTPALEGCPTMDKSGQMYFVSPRDYPRTLCTIYTGQFRAGSVTNVQVVESISRKEPGIVNFDVDVSPDGKMLIFVDSRFKPGGEPQSADLVIAEWDGAKFVRSAESRRILASVNALGLEYAPTISADKRTLYFTRYDGASAFKGPQIYRAARSSASSPFSTPVHLDGLGDYVEGSALSPTSGSFISIGKKAEPSGFTLWRCAERIRRPSWRFWIAASAKRRAHRFACPWRPVLTLRYRR